MTGFKAELLHRSESARPEVRKHPVFLQCSFSAPSVEVRVATASIQCIAVSKIGKLPIQSILVPCLRDREDFQF